MQSGRMQRPAFAAQSRRVLRRAERKMVIEMDYLKEFEHPSSRFRGAPFWAWNTKLDRDTILKQIDVFREMGMGGFTMHCRTGLNTPYLGEEFLDVVKACVDKAGALQMKACLYDEDRWPSGACGGAVTKDPEFRSRYLVFTPFSKEEGTGRKESESISAAKGVFTGKGTELARYQIELRDGRLAAYRRLAPEEEADGAWYAYLEISEPSSWYNNETYVNTLNKRAIERFAETTHEVYAGAVGAEFGKAVPSIFTDEPQFVHKETLGKAEEKKPLILPYTDDFEDSYRAAYGESFLDRLPEVVWELPDGVRSLTRYRYHDHIAQRFAEAFSDTLGEWCESHGIALTGHMMEEPTLQSQTAAISEAMRHYRGFQIPGIDMLCDSREYTTAKQAQSAVHQFGRNEMTSELYGVTNWDFDFRRHKLQGDWQAALGVTHRVHHLSWVSMEGEAKRDYPASIFFQSPWYREYRLLEDHYARVNTALQSGRPQVRIGVIHPIESYWLWFGPKEQTADMREKLERQFQEVTEWLLFGLLDFDYICESLLQEMPEGNDGKFQVGEMAYDAVVVPGCVTLRRETLRRLSAFAAEGGKVVFLGEAPTHVDAVPSEEPQRLAEACTQIGFDRSLLLRELEPWRLVDLKDENGVRTNEYLSQLRKTEEGYLLFLANGRAIHGEDVPEARKLTVELPAEYKLTLLDTLTGKRSPLPAEYQGGRTVLQREFYGQDSLLLQLEPGRNPAGQTQKQPSRVLVSPLCHGKGYRLEEPNALLLDQAEYAVDGGSFQPCEELLRADTAVRKRLGYPADGGNVAQPWTLEEEPYEHQVSLRFTIEAEQNVGRVKLALEQAALASVSWDGEPVKGKPEGWYVDPCLSVLPLAEVTAGRHTLEIVLPYHSKSSLEWCYLLGEFGVRVRGRTAVLTAMPADVGFGDLTNQGFPFYGGNFTYLLEVETEEGEYELSAAKYRSPVLCVKVDGEKRGDIAFSPYRVSLGRLSRGRHLIELTACGSRINTFGQVHLTDEELTWFGPESWRTGGDRFSYEYQLKRTGVLAAPMLFKLI